MNIIDIIIIIVLLYAFLKGFFNGFINEISSFIGFLIAAFVSYNFSGPLSNLLIDFVEIDKKKYQKMLKQDQSRQIAGRTLNEILSRQQKNNCENLTFKINSIISINAITLDLIEEIDKAGPFGPDSPKPIFVVKNCKIKWCNRVNKTLQRPVL